MGDLNQIKENWRELKQSGIEYIKNRLFLISFVTGITGLNAGVAWYYWEIFQALPAMYENYREDHNQSLEDHEQSVRDSLRYNRLLILADSLPSYNYQLNTYKPLFKKVMKDVEDTKQKIEDIDEEIDDVKDDVKKIDDDVYDLERNVRNINNSNRTIQSPKF